MDTPNIPTQACSHMESVLRQNPLFSRLDNEQLDRMCKCSRIVELAEGDVLFNHGDRVHSFYFVYKGLIKLYRQSALGQEKIFEMEKTGSTFAEALMFLDQTEYPVSAAAMQDSTLVAINTHEFLQILKLSADSCLLIMGDLSKRLHELITEIEHLSLMSGRNRVATYFLDIYLLKGTDFSLEIPKNAIASMLSLQPETFSRLLKELRSKQIIELTDNRVQILDATQLREFAGIALPKGSNHYL